MSLHESFLLRPACSCEVQPMLTLARTRFSLFPMPSHAGAVMAAVLLPGGPGRIIAKTGSSVVFSGSLFLSGQTAFK